MHISMRFFSSMPSGSHYDVTVTWTLKMGPLLVSISLSLKLKMTSTISTAITNFCFFFLGEGEGGSALFDIVAYPGPSISQTQMSLLLANAIFVSNGNYDEKFRKQCNVIYVMRAK